MNRDDLDRVLADRDDLVPSSGFAASVMEAVQREASAPRPLPFPWIRALPGLIALAVALAAGTWTGIGVLDDPATLRAMDAQFQSLVSTMRRPEIGWLALAAIVTTLPAVLALRLMRGHV